MIGDEARIVDAFDTWLTEHGWLTQREVDFVDIAADRDGRRLYVEAKGRTTSPGLDIDTLYGQLLRRMPGKSVGEDLFAVVVPGSAVATAERVPPRVRKLLRIEIYGVDETGRVTHAGPGDDPLL